MIRQLSEQKIGGLFSFFLVGLLCSSSYGQFTTVLNIPPDPNIGEDQFIGSNTQINVFAGGEIGGGLRLGAGAGSSSNIELNVSGGKVGFFEGGKIATGIRLGNFDGSSPGIVLNVSGGQVGSINAYAGSVVNLNGGSLSGPSNAYDGSFINISGGTLAVFFDALSGSTVKISGGSIGRFFTAYEDSHVTISGGSFDGMFQALGGSHVLLKGTQFTLDGQDLSPSLTVGIPYAINDRGVALQGVLADGSGFNFPLDSGFASDAFLAVMLIPEPASFLLFVIGLFGNSCGRSCRRF